MDSSSLLIVSSKHVICCSCHLDKLSSTSTIYQYLLKILLWIYIWYLCTYDIHIRICINLYEYKYSLCSYAIISKYAHAPSFILCVSSWQKNRHGSNSSTKATVVPLASNLQHEGPVWLSWVVRCHADHLVSRHALQCGALPQFPLLAVVLLVVVVWLVWGSAPEPAADSHRPLGWDPAGNPWLEMDSTWRTVCGTKVFERFVNDVSGEHWICIYICVLCIFVYNIHITYLAKLPMFVNRSWLVASKIPSLPRM